MSDAIITPELLQWIGRKTPLRQLEIIGAADVRRYVDATGDAVALDAKAIGRFTAGPIHAF